MDKSAIGLKLLMSFDVNTAQLQEYYRFVMGSYLPSMQAMGLQMSEAWHTAYGNAPSRLLGFICEDRDTIDEVLHNEKWGELNEQLLQYVSQFSYKVVPYRGGFQI